MNVPSYNALFTSRDKAVKTIMELCEEVNKSGGGGSSNVFTYELYLSDFNFSSPGTYPIQDDNLAPAIHNAIKAGKQVYISLTNDHISHIILPLASTTENPVMGGYSFGLVTIGGSSSKHSIVSFTLLVMYSEQQSQSSLDIVIADIG